MTTLGGLHREPGRYAVVRLGGLVAGVAVIALTLGGCSSASREVTIDGDPAEFLARAAGSPTGSVRFRLEASLESEGVRILQSMTGLITPDGDSHLAGTVDTDYPDLDDEADVGMSEALEQLSGTWETISVDGAVYQRGPLAGAPSLPDGVEWTVNRGSAPGSPGTSSVSVDASGFLEPLELLDLLGSARDVEDRGPAEIDGVPVRHLHAVLADTGDGSDPDAPPSEVDVYIDRDEQVRRVVWTTDSGEASVRATLDYLELDSDEEVTPPPAEETIDQYELFDG